MSPLFIVVTTVVCAFALCFAVAALFHARGLLRHRFAAAERLALADLALGPAWLGLEVVCLILDVILTLVLLWAAAAAATQLRDWWHAGNKR